MSKPTVNYLFTRTTLAHAVAGSVGSMAAMTLCYPLDRVRTLAQVGGETGGVLDILVRMFKQEGFWGVYKGLRPVLVSLGTSNFVYFYFFIALKAIWHRLRPKKALALGAIEDLVLASIAGTINVFVTTPLWVAATRLASKRRRRPTPKLAPQPVPKLAPQPVPKLKRQPTSGSTESTNPQAAPTSSAKPASNPAAAPMTDQSATNLHSDTNQIDQKYHNDDDDESIVAEIMSIAKEEGVAGLWSGIMPSLILVSNPSVQFAAYEKLKEYLLNFKMGTMGPRNVGPVLDMEQPTTEDVQRSLSEASITSVEYLFLGAFAKMIATLVTYPLQVAQSKMRAADNSPTNKNIHYTSTSACLKHIYQTEGFAGLYKGMDAKMLQTCLTSAFMFASYEKLTHLIFSIVLWNKFKSKVTMA